LHTTYIPDDTIPEVPVDPLPDQPDQVSGGKYWPHSGPLFSAGAGIYRIRYGSPLKFIASAPRTGMLTHLSTWWVWDAATVSDTSALSGGDPAWDLKVEAFLWSGNGVLGAPENPRILLLNPWSITSRTMIADSGQVGGALKMALTSPVSVNLDQQIAWQITNLNASDTGAVGSDTSKFISVRMVSQSKLATQLIYYPFGKTPPTHSGPAWGDLRYPGTVVPNAGYDLTNVPTQLAWYSDSDARPWGMAYPMASGANNRPVRTNNAFRTKLVPPEDVTLGAIWFVTSYPVAPKPTASLIIEIRKDSDSTLVAQFTISPTPLTEVGWDVTAGTGNPTLYHQARDGGGSFDLVGGVTYNVIIKGPASGGLYRVCYQLVDDYSVQTAANKLAFPWNYNPSGTQPMHGLWPGAVTEISTDNGVTYPAPNLSDPVDITRRRIQGGSGANGICLHAIPPILFDKSAYVDPDPVDPPDPVDDVTIYNQDLPYGGQYDGLSTMLGNAGNCGYWDAKPKSGTTIAQNSWSTAREATYTTHQLEYCKSGVKLKWIQWNNREDSAGSHIGYSRNDGGEIEISVYKCDSGYRETLKVGTFLAKTRSLVGPVPTSSWRTEWQQQGGGSSDTIPTFFKYYPTMEFTTPVDLYAAGLRVGDFIVFKFLQKSHVDWISTNNAYSQAYNTGSQGKSPFPYAGKNSAYYTLGAAVHNYMIPMVLVGYDDGVVTGSGHFGSSSTSQPVPETNQDYITLSSANGHRVRMVIPCTRDGTSIKRFFSWPLREGTTSTTGAMRVKILEAGVTTVPDFTSDMGTQKHTFDIAMSNIPYVRDAKTDPTSTLWQTVSLGSNKVDLTNGKSYYVELSSTGAEVTFFCMIRICKRAFRGLLQSRNMRTKSQYFNGSSWYTLYDSGTTSGGGNSGRNNAQLDLPIMVSYI